MKFIDLYLDIITAFALRGDGGSSLDVESLSVTENGTYEAEEGTAFNPVTVNVPSPELKTYAINMNGDYDSPSGTAWNHVRVSVPKQRLTVTENGTYNHTAQTTGGFSPVVVNVPQLDAITGNFSANGSYVAPSGKAYDNVNVNVPQPSTVPLQVTANGDYYPETGTLFDYVSVNVSGGGGVIIDSLVAQSDSDYYPAQGHAFGQVTVSTGQGSYNRKRVQLDAPCNGSFVPSSDYCFAPVAVNVALAPGTIENPTLVELYTHGDGTYTPAVGYAFSAVHVVTEGAGTELTYTLESLSVTQNDTYSPAESWQAYDQVDVDVAVSGGGDAMAKKIQGMAYEYSSDEVTGLCAKALATDENITAISLPNCISSGAAPFADCHNLESVELPKLANIADSMFESCSKLTKVDVHGAETVGESAFKECSSLRELWFGPGLQSIGRDAFYANSQMEIYIEATTPPAMIYQDVFSSTPADAIYVPDSAYSLYENDSEWGQIPSFILQPYTFSS